MSGQWSYNILVVGEEGDRGQLCCVQWRPQDLGQLDGQEFHRGGRADGPGEADVSAVTLLISPDSLKVLPDDMIAIRKSLHDMESHIIGCGPAGAAQPDEVVRITWVDEDKAVNIG